MTIKHAEMEWCVPVSIMGVIGEWMDDYFAVHPSAAYLDEHGLWSLRYMHGSDSLTAANGMMLDETLQDVVSVNVDIYQRKYCNTFHAEVCLLSEAMTMKAFPGNIRAHPGQVQLAGLCRKARRSLTSLLSSIPDRHPSVAKNAMRIVSCGARGFCRGSACASPMLKGFQSQPRGNT